MPTYDQYFSTISTCPFCDDQQHNTLHTTEHHYLCAALAPYAPHHLLILPKKHVVSLTDYTAPMLADLQALQLHVTHFLYDRGYTELVWMLRDSIDTDVIKYTNSKTGKSIAHFHYHVIPECNLTAKHLVDKNISDTRPMITNADIQHIKEEWGKISGYSKLITHGND